MTSYEKDEVIERILFGKATPDEQNRFDRWMTEDTEFKETFEFRKNLGAQLRRKQREALKQDFKQIRAELGKEEQVKTEPAAIPLWRKTWFIAAASVVLLLVAFQIFKPSSVREDTANITKEKTSKPTGDTPRSDVAKVEIPHDSGKKEIAQPGNHPELKQLPLYETGDESLGFGKTDKSVNILPVLFIPGNQWKYEFEDTLKIYMPESAWKRRWTIIYNRPEDHYILSNSKEKYQIISGLKGKKNLVKVSKE